MQTTFLRATLIFLLGLATSGKSFAETIYTCKEDKSSIISWQYAGKLKKAGLEAESYNSPEKSVSIVFVVTEKKAIVKGTTTQFVLKKISANSFSEEALSGDNLIMWTVVPGKKGAPTYIFQQKAYETEGPVAVTIAYKCD